MITRLFGSGVTISRFLQDLVHPFEKLPRRQHEAIQVKLARRHLLELLHGNEVGFPQGIGCGLTARWVVICGYGCDITEEDYSWAVIF